jgi:hypothetical protein
MLESFSGFDAGQTVVASAVHHADATGEGGTLVVAALYAGEAFSHFIKQLISLAHSGKAGMESGAVVRVTGRALTQSFAVIRSFAALQFVKIGLAEPTTRAQKIAQTLLHGSSHQRAGDWISPRLAIKDYYEAQSGIEVHLTSFEKDGGQLEAQGCRPRGANCEKTLAADHGRIAVTGRPRRINKAAWRGTIVAPARV